MPPLNTLFGGRRRTLRGNIDFYRFGHFQANSIPLLVMYDEDPDDGFHEGEILDSLDLPDQYESKSKASTKEPEGPTREELLKNNTMLQGELEQLQLLIGDLSRRLQNAHHTIDSFRLNANDAIRSGEGFRKRYEDVSRMYQMELNRTEMTEHKKKKEQELRKYERLKKECEKMHEDYRFAVIDHQASGLMREPTKVKKMKAELEEMEQRADSQKMLLTQYGELEEKTEQLSLAAQSGEIARVHTLLREGLSPNRCDSAGFLPLHYACARGHTDTARLLLEHGSDHSSYLTGYAPIELCARSGSVDIIRELLYFGADLEETGKGGRPPLVSACANQHLDAMALLLDSGADIDARDVKGNTALHEAVRHKEPVDFVYLLMRRGADTRVQNLDEKNPMELAMSIANVLALEALGGRKMPSKFDDDNDEGGEGGGGGGGGKWEASNASYGPGGSGGGPETVTTNAFQNESVVSALTFK